MTVTVVKLLTTGAMENAKRLRFLKLGLLSDFLSGDDDTSVGYANLLTCLSGRCAADVVESGTPFFWKNVHRCCQNAVHQDNNLRRSADFMLRTAFDSFFDLLPDGFSLTFAPDDEASLVFPRLGVQVQTQGQRVTACRLNQNEVQLTASGNKTRIRLDDIPPPLKIRKLRIPNSGGAELLMVKDCSLFEDDYIDRLVTRSEQDEFLARLIGKSLDLIEAAMPELHPRFVPFIRWYFPIDAPDALTHNSLSVKYMSGAMFLSVAYHDFRLAEAMVHELHHNELYLLQETESLLEQRDEDVFYSPFRTDPRPLNGLFHALFVFAGVADFIARAETVSALADYWESMRLRRCQVVHQLRLGFAQVPRERLTELGTCILSSIQETIERHEEEIGSLAGQLPAKLAEHVKTWREAHPQLAERIQFPSRVDFAR